MANNFSQYFKRNNRNWLVFLFSLCFAGILSYVVTSPGLGSTEFLKVAPYFFWATFIVSVPLSYILYFLYSFIAINLFKKKRAPKLFYGSIISTIIGLTLILLSYFKKSPHSGWDLYFNYSPAIILYFFVLSTVVDLFVIFKNKQDKLRFVGSILV